MSTKQLKYIDNFLNLKAASEMQRMKLFPNAKEITESIGCFNAVMKMLGGMETNACRSDLTCIIVGDGSTPRTGALFAYRTRWTVISYDPNIKHGVWDCIKRLKAIRGMAEDYPQHYEGDLVLVFPHSHANSKKVLNALTCTGKRTIVWLPCCTQMDIAAECVSWTDEHIASPKNRFFCWADLS